MSSSLLRAGVAAVVLAAAVPALAPVAAGALGRPDFDVQAHRGGLGLRSESTLASFGNAMRLGVSTLELDVQITKEGVAVVTHDRRTNAALCRDTAPATPGDPAFPYVGKYVVDLTLAQVQTLDCGSTQRAGHPQQETIPGARIPTLRSVFDLVRRYDAPVRLNVETKVEVTAPHETASIDQFATTVAREVRRAGFLDRVTIQSFAWEALRRMRQVEPRLPISALMEPWETRRGIETWLGLDPRDYDGNLVRAARSFRPDAISPLHGTPQDGGVGRDGYRPFATRELVREAQRSGIDVIPWTVNDQATMRKLIDDGVDGIITDYPDRLREVMAERRLRLPHGTAAPFDVQAHRGGRAQRPENTLAAFAHALSQPGVSTLELDTVVTRDGRLVVSHDRRVNGAHCSDTAPVREGDRLFPYVGKPLRELTFAQLRTLDCGSQVALPGQETAPGERIPELAEVLALVRSSGRDDVRLNVETKLSPLAPIEGASPREHAELLVRELRRGRLLDRSTVQSFDWRTIREAQRIDRRVETVALVWQYGPAECVTLADECSLQALFGDRDVPSPWTAGLDWWRWQDLGKLVRRSGADTVSANWQVHDPDQAAAPHDDWYLRTDPSYFHGPDVDGLHAQGLRVVPYTLNDPAVMQRSIDLGVDGIITDDPPTLIAVAKRNGLR